MRKKKELEDIAKYVLVTTSVTLRDADGTGETAQKIIIALQVLFMSFIDEISEYVSKYDIADGQKVDDMLQRKIAENENGLGDLLARYGIVKKGIKDGSNI